MAKTEYQIKLQKAEAGAASHDNNQVVVSTMQDQIQQITYYDQLPYKGLGNFVQIKEGTPDLNLSLYKPGFHYLLIVYILPN